MKYLGYKILLVGIPVLIFGGAYLMAPGSNVYAQDYVFHSSQDSLTHRLLQLKREHPELVPSEDEPKAQTDKTKMSDISVRIPSLKEVAYAYFVENRQKSFTTVRLVAFKADTIGGSAKRINEDYGRSENLKRKKAFRKEFLDLANIEYFDDGNSMFIFWK